MNEVSFLFLALVLKSSLGSSFHSIAMQKIFGALALLA
jgi:hypothetical protein